MPRRLTPDPLALAIGQRIRLLRTEAGLTMEKLAYESELGSKGHLSNLERGLVMPTVASLKKLAERLGVLVADLVNNPEENERARLLELTRSLPRGSVRHLVREASPPTSRSPRRAPRLSETS